MTSSRLPNRERDTPSSAPIGSAPLVVLLIDDEAKIRAAVRDALSSDHVEMIDAASGAAGLTTAEARRHD